MTDLLLALIALLVTGIGFMAKHHMTRSEGHFKQMHQLVNIVHIHEFAIGQLWKKEFSEPYPFSLAEAKNIEKDDE